MCRKCQEKPIREGIKDYWAKPLLTWPHKYLVYQLNNPLGKILINYTPLTVPCTMLLEAWQNQSNSCLWCKKDHKKLCIIVTAWKSDNFIWYVKHLMRKIVNGCVKRNILQHTVTVKCFKHILCQFYLHGVNWGVTENMRTMREYFCK